MSKLLIPWKWIADHMDAHHVMIGGGLVPGIAFKNLMLMHESEHMFQFWKRQDRPFHSHAGYNFPGIETVFIQERGPMKMES